MQKTLAQIWKPAPFTIASKGGKAPGTVIFRLSGPFTARTMFGTLAPIALHNMLSFQSTPSDALPTLNILDITDVPYMDSAGLGIIVTHYERCQSKGIRMIAANVNPRVLELFRMTKVDSIIHMANTVDEVDIP